ncbi:MAG TPA: Trm112 family protein [Azospirillum sp.]|nr:Trm112 family protein [Azospirillum sp.]
MSASTPQDKAGEGKTTDSKSQARVDPKLLEILVCPLTKGPLRYDSERNELISDRAGLAYPIRDGIPIMLIDEARRLDDHPIRGPGAA